MFLVLYFGLLPCLVLGRDDHFKDFFTYDYCKLNCEDAVHSACKCKVTRPRKEVTTNPDQPTFRQEMLDAHNRLRSIAATGKEERPEPGMVGPSSNMMIMNYDLELEHIARCYGVNTYNKDDRKVLGHDKCRVRYGNKKVGQNLHGRSQIEGAEWAVGWYNEVVDMAEYMFDYFNSTYTKDGQNVHVGHFTQLVWWSADMVGCFRVWKPDNLEAWKFTILCNYGSSFERSPGNLMYKPIFKKGEICTECPENTKCETEKYPGLCGTLYPAPKDPLQPLTDGKAGTDFNRANKIILAVTLLLIFFF